MKQRLLVSVRGPVEALEAAKGGAHIVDVEYPASALGTPYPLNVAAVRDRLLKSGFRRVAVSTNIGEIQHVRSAACQAALGIVVAGASLLKFGLAEENLASASYLGRAIVRTVKSLGPKSVKLFPVVFADQEMRRFLNPLVSGPELAARCHADGLLIDTFNKAIGKGLLDYYSPNEIARLVRSLHRRGKEAWVAGSITRDELRELWAIGVDVVCVRGAACAPGSGSGRFGRVQERIVRDLVSTLPR